MKINMLIGKRQIILASLVLILSVAVYLNWQFASNSGATLPKTETEQTGNYGEAEYVNTKDREEDYFTKARIERQQIRDNNTEELAAMLEETGLTEEDIAQYAQGTLSQAEFTADENEIETLVRAKGFEECLAYCDSENVSVVVSSASKLTDSQLAQIKEIVINQTDIDPENLTVTAVS